MLVFLFIFAILWCLLLQAQVNENRRFLRDLQDRFDGKEHVLSGEFAGLRYRIENREIAHKLLEKKVDDKFAHAVTATTVLADALNIEIGLTEAVPRRLIAIKKPRRAAKQKGNG